MLVLTQTLGYHHASIRGPSRPSGGSRPLRRFRVVFLPGAASLTQTLLKRAAAVVFLLTSGELPLSRSGKRALIAYVHAGGGLVGFHSATETFHHWPGSLD